jgi:hypothetical protein
LTVVATVLSPRPGEFIHNKKDGKGIFTWPTGNVYKGQFKEEKMCGKGEMTYTTGHRYARPLATGCARNSEATPDVTARAFCSQHQLL